MRTTLKKAASDGIRTYASQPRCEWIFQQPAQLVPAISQIFWCQKVTAALSGTSVFEDLRTLQAEGVNELDDLTELVGMELTPMQRRVAVALITIDVHNRDVVSTLSHAGCCSPSDFTWQMQLRCAARFQKNCNKTTEVGFLLSLRMV
jgi:dynein heavy chain